MTESISNSPLLRLQSVSKSFRAGDIMTLALRDVNFEVMPGEFVSIIGESGSGKSTLLNVVGMLENFDSGYYVFQGKNIDSKAKDSLRIRSMYFGFVFQSFHLIDSLNVLDNVSLSLRFSGLPRREIASRAREVLTQLNMSHRENHFPSQLSGGQQQRIALARALAPRPEILLADEPTGNLDSTTAVEIMDVLQTLNNGGTAIVMVTHSLELAKRAKRIVAMKDGQIQPAQI